MQVLLFVTHTADCQKFGYSLQAIGHETTSVVYDDRPHSEQVEFVRQARARAPGAIVYLGAIEKYHGRPVLQPNILKQLRDVAPTIHICGDGSDWPWWEWLALYEKKGCFSAQVNIDGALNCPLSHYKTGLVMLTPTDPRFFGPWPAWAERSTWLGTVGGKGHTRRTDFLEMMKALCGMEWPQPEEYSYAEMAKFLMGCRLVANSSMNGTGDIDHVKGRLIEAAWAGAAVLEFDNPVSRHWFKPDELVWYRDGNDAMAKVKWARQNDAEVAAIAARLHAKISTEHHPASFWRKVFGVAGVKA